MEQPQPLFSDHPSIKSSTLTQRSLKLQQRTSEGGGDVELAGSPAKEVRMASLGTCYSAMYGGGGVNDDEMGTWQQLGWEPV